MGSEYHSQKKGEEMRISGSPIYLNMSSLYLIEPLNFQIVYSDVFQEFVQIIFLKTHNYKIILPDGNYNELMRMALQADKSASFSLRAEDPVFSVP